MNNKHILVLENASPRGKIVNKMEKRECVYDTALSMGAGTGGAGWASAHPGKNQGGHGPPWKF